MEGKEVVEEEEEDGGSVGRDREKDRASLSQSAGRGRRRRRLQREGDAVSREDEGRPQVQDGSRLGEGRSFAGVWW